MSSPGIIAWPKAPAPRSRRGDSLCRQGAQVVLRHRVGHHGSGRLQRRRRDRRRVPALQPRAGRGLNKVAGKLFRIGHLGDLNELMLMSGIAGAEMAMRDVGIKVTPGSGVAAAERVLAQHRRTDRRASHRPASPTPPSRLRLEPLAPASAHEPYALRAGPGPPAAQRAGGARVQSGDVPQGARERGGLRLPRPRGRRGAGRQGSPRDRTSSHGLQEHDWRPAGRRSAFESTGSTPTTCTAT